MASSLFIKPDLEAFALDPSAPAYGKCLSYSHYNYLSGGLIPRIKRKRFEAALQMVRPWFGRANAIDMGCADGILLPSLATHFGHATGIDHDPACLKVAGNLVSGLGLKNVDTFDNTGLGFGDLRERLSGRPYGVAFVLETLEHIGKSPETMYQDKLEFLDGLFSLLTDDGVIVISVPKMVGLPFLLKYVVQTAARLPKEPVSFREGMRAVFLKDASLTERRWSGGHVGFNDYKLGRLLEEKYKVVARRNLAATAMWAIARRESQGRP
jgi:hypothetical protein